MVVVSFASLKGGVGKTTLSVNIARAYAEQGAKTVLIDLDPMGHATRFFTPVSAQDPLCSGAAIAKLFLADASNGQVAQSTEEIAALLPEYVMPVSDRLAVLSSGAGLRNFLWGRGAQVYRRQFPLLLHALEQFFDVAIIDTAPDYNVVTRNALAHADIVTVPVDGSAMSIKCLEDLVNYSTHMQGPSWLVLRTMVQKRATRVQRMTNEQLEESLGLRAEPLDSEPAEPESVLLNGSDLDPEDFIAALRAETMGEPSLEDEGKESGAAGDAAEQGEESENKSPVFLLNQLVYRTELQNSLSFSRKTAFDSKKTAKLAEQYRAVRDELEFMLNYTSSRPEQSIVPKVRNDEEDIGQNFSTHY